MSRLCNRNQGAKAGSEVCALNLPGVRKSNMFENLQDRLSGSLRKISGQARLTDDNIKDTLREVRMALLEADVALPVVKDFVEGVRQRAIGQEVQRSLTPGQVFVKVVQQELERVMGEGSETLNLAVQPPAVIMMAGLQGAGKTTTVEVVAFSQGAAQEISNGRECRCLSAGCDQAVGDFGRRGGC